MTEPNYHLNPAEEISPIELAMLRLLASRPQGYAEYEVVDVCVTRLERSHDSARSAFATLKIMELVEYSPLNEESHNYTPTKLGLKHIEDFS